MDQPGLSEVASQFKIDPTAELNIPSVLNRLPVGVAIVGHDHRVSYCNKTLYALLNKAERDQACDQQFGDLIRSAFATIDEQAQERSFQHWLLNSSSTGKADDVFRLEGGKWIQLISRPLDAGRLLVTLVDVSELKRREVWLTELHDRLAGEGEDLKLFARHLATARHAATEALGKAEAANAALAREIAERRALERELRRMANTDSLTGVLNRRRFLEIAEKQLERADKGIPIIALMLDLDHFKRINDGYGHSAGDEALCAFSRVCRDILGENALFSRFGGEEFAAILPNTNLESGLEIAEHIRKQVHSMRFKFDGRKIRLGVSIGVAVATAPSSQSIAILDRADQALYAAKQAGRNCVAYQVDKVTEVVSPSVVREVG